MIVCHCNAISDREVRRACRHGASTVEQVARACDAGDCCGGCHPRIEQLIDEASAEQRTESSRITLPNLVPVPA